MKTSFKWTSPGTLRVVLLVAAAIVTAYALVFPEPLLRPLHVLTSVAWFGMVFFINFILLPTMKVVDDATRYDILIEIFPRVFNTATVVSTISVLAGAGLLIRILLIVPLNVLARSTRGIALLISVLMATALYLFHLTLEKREITAIKKFSGDPQKRLTPEAEQLLKNLKLVPRLGFFVISTILILMIYTSHP